MASFFDTTFLMFCGISALNCVNWVCPVSEHRFERDRLRGLVVSSFILENLLVLALAFGTVALTTLLPYWVQAPFIWLMILAYGTSILSYRKSGTYINNETIKYFTASPLDLLRHSASLPTSQSDKAIFPISIVSALLCHVALFWKYCYFMPTLYFYVTVISASTVWIACSGRSGASRQSRLPSRGFREGSLYFLSYHAGPVSNFLWNRRYVENEAKFLRSTSGDKY